MSYLCLPFILSAIPHLPLMISQCSYILLFRSVHCTTPIPNRSILHRQSLAGSSLQNPLLLPPLPQLTDTDSRAVHLSFDISDFQQLVFFSKCQEVGKQRIEVGLGSQMEDNVKVRVIKMRENAEELAIDALHGRGEGRVE